MHDYKVVDGMVRTVSDGLKDAWMQLEWAEEAKEAGEHEAAMLHLEEAKQRVARLGEWQKRAMDCVSKNMEKLTAAIDKMKM